VQALSAALPDGEIIVGTLAGVPPHSGGARRIALDITDAERVRMVLAAERPTHVFHLAAIAAVQTARLDVRQTWAVNFGGAFNVALAVAEIIPDCRLLYCGSAQVYGGNFRAGHAVDESTAFDPIDAYGASKAAADLMIGQMAKQGLRAIRLRPFNHTGAGQGKGFVVPDFAAQIAAIERGEQEPVIKVGNLESRRDLLDVHDVADAYVRAVLHFNEIPPGAAINVASGEAISVGQILSMLLSLSPRSIEVVQDAERVRSSDISVIRGDASLARRLLGWKPQRAIADTLRAVLEHYRELGAKP